jgi:Uma2 family endonuclease
MTFDEYLKWLDEDTLADWVKGELSYHNFPRTLKHQDLLGFLTTLTQVFAEEKDLGEVLGLKYLMYLPNVPSARQPDIMFVSNFNKHRLTEYYLNGAADLVIEIVSPESVVRDTQDKFEEYEAAGVKEYWIIDPKCRTVNFYGFDENQKYKLLPISAAGKFESRIIEGLWIKTDWLWQDKLPNLIEVLKDWKLV